MEDGDGGGDQLFAEVSYRMIGFDDYVHLEKHYKGVIDKRGGKHALRFDKTSCTHLIVYSETVNYDDGFCSKAREFGINVVNEMWVDDTVSCGVIADLRSVMYSPVRNVVGIPGCVDLHISVSGYSLVKTTQIQRMIHMMGATFCKEWTEKGTHLIAYEFQGLVYSNAKKCKAKVVNHKWIEDCLKEWKVLPDANYNISGLDLDLILNQTKDAKKHLSCKAKTPQRVEQHTPEMKASTDKRKAHSAGSKRFSVRMDNGTATKCKRALTFRSPSSSAELSLLEYAVGGLTRKTEIPYGPDRSMAKEGAKVVFLNAYGLVIDLHREGKSLKGKFNSKNSMLVCKTKKVRLHGIEPQRYNEGDDVLDKTQFVAMVERMFGDDLPEDVMIWLECIQEGDDDNVVTRHINMLHDSDIFGEFSVMYHNMVMMKDLELNKFLLMLDDLRKYNVWVKRPFNWKILEDNRRDSSKHFQDDRGAQKDDIKTGEDYKATVFGLVREIRNCFEHPAKRYIRVLLAVLLGEHRKLLSDVQKSLYEIGYLHQLDVEHLD